MKSIKLPWIFLFVFSFSVTAFADDIATQMTAEIDAYIAGLKSSDYGKVVDTANKISASGLSDTRLFDVVEKILLDFHQKQLASPKDETLVPPVIALIRALGSCGDNKYRPTLARILDKSKSRAARNRAKHVMGKMSWYGQRNAKMQDLANHKPVQSLQSTRFINLLTDEDDIFKRYAAEEIYRLGSAEPVLVELMASELEKGASNEKDKLHIDTLAWYCRALVKVDKPDYEDFIQKIIDDRNTNRKIRRHCNKELKRN